jgi:hypothetical protein
MSEVKSKSKSKSSNIRMPPSCFCKVCKDAGLPESDYTSHFVKDRPGPNGKVVCPTLLNQACLMCGNKGHTSSYCSENPNYKATQVPIPAPAQSRAHVPYAHPHGPRIRLQLDGPALSAYDRISCVEGAETEAQVSGQMISLVPPIDIDVRKVNLMHAPCWGDEPVVHMNPGFQKIAEDAFMRTFITDEEYNFIVACDENNEYGRPIFECGD